MDKHTEKLLSEILANTNKISDTLEKHSKILDNHTQILNEHTNILTEHTNILNEHSNRLENLEKTSAEHSEKLQRIENIVTKMEIEHGDKLQILFDYFTTDSTRFSELKQEIAKINFILDKYDARIYYLEFHKNKLLPIK